MAPAADYFLPGPEVDRIFLEEILPVEFKDQPIKRPATLPGHPLAVIVVGQTGAGKSHFAPLILAALDRLGRQPMHLVADTYKAYHPQYEHLFNNRPEIASPATARDARLWLSMAARETAVRRLDVVVESACRYPEDFIELCKLFHGFRYRVETVVLAVHESVSRLGTYARYYIGKEDAQQQESRETAQSASDALAHGTAEPPSRKVLPNRLTPKSVHDATYAGLLDCARFIDQSGDVDQVVIVRRHGIVSYLAERSDRDTPWGRVAWKLPLERNASLMQDELDEVWEQLAMVRRFNEKAADEISVELTRVTMGSSRRDPAETLRLMFPPVEDAVGVKFQLLKLGEIVPQSGSQDEIGEPQERIPQVAGQEVDER